MIAQFYGTALIFEAFFSTGNLVKIFAADCTDALQCIHHAIHRSRPDAAVFLQSFIVNFFTAGALLFQDNIKQNPSLSGYSASLFPELLNNQFSLHLCSVIISGFMLCLFLRHTFYLLMMIPVLSVAMSLALPAVTTTASLAAFFIFNHTAYCKSYQTNNDYKCDKSSHRNNSFLFKRVRILQRMPDTDSSSDTCSLSVTAIIC